MMKRKHWIMGIGAVGGITSLIVAMAKKPDPIDCGTASADIHCDTPNVNIWKSCSKDGEILCASTTSLGAIMTTFAFSGLFLGGLFSNE